MSDVDDVLDWVGAETDTAVVTTQLTRFAGEEFVVARAALAILLRRQADWGPSKWAVSGDYSEDSTDSYKWLLAQITRLRTILGDEVSDLPTLTQAPIIGPGNLR